MTNAMASPIGDAFLTRAETAAFLRVSPITIYRLVERGILPAYHICRRLLFKHDDVIAFAESGRRDARTTDVV